MAFSPDGSRLLAVTDDLTVSVWDPKQLSKMESRELQGPSIPPGRFGYGPTTISGNLQVLAFAMGEGRVRVVDLSTGEALWETKAAEERITELALSPDGSILASSGGFVESTIRIWDVRHGHEIARLEGHRTFVQSLVFWPDGKTLASASGDQTIRLWDVGPIDEGREREAERLLPAVYNELRRIAASKMAREAPGHTLQPTALVHKAWLRMFGGTEQHFDGRAHFFTAAAEAMRRILVDSARRKKSQKRGSGERPVDLQDVQISPAVPSDEMLAIDEALDLLAAENPAAADLVKLKYFVGMTMEDAAGALGISLRTAERTWKYARAWLRRKVTDSRR